MLFEPEQKNKINISEALMTVNYTPTQVKNGIED